MLPHILGLKQKHFGDLLCLICPDIMEHGYKTEVP